VSYACKWGAVAATACMQRCWMDPPFLLARGQRCPTCCGARAGFFLPPAFFLGTPIVAASCRGCGCRVKWMEKAIQACLRLARSTHLSWRFVGRKRRPVRRMPVLICNQSSLDTIICVDTFAPA
jgi:hypothetical protein